MIVVGAGDEQEKIVQALFDDEPLQIAHVGVDDTGRAALQHVEAGDLAGCASLVNFEQLADADRQGQALPSGGVLQAPAKMAAVERSHLRRRCKPSQPTDIARDSAWYCEKLGK